MAARTYGNGTVACAWSAVLWIIAAKATVIQRRVSSLHRHVRGDFYSGTRFRTQRGVHERARTACSCA